MSEAHNSDDDGHAQEDTVTEVSQGSRRKKHGPCALCLRNVSLTFHHLIPRKLHRRKRFAKHYSKEQLNTGIMICHRCHRGLHRLYGEMELGSKFYTLDHLKQDEAVMRHVAWVSKQKS